MLLTESGMKIAKRMDDIICDVVNQIGGSLSEEERACMYYALNVIDKNLEQLTKKN